MTGNALLAGSFALGALPPTAGVVTEPSACALFGGRFTGTPHPGASAGG